MMSMLLTPERHRTTAGICNGKAGYFATEYVEVYDPDNLVQYLYEHAKKRNKKKKNNKNKNKNQK